MSATIDAITSHVLDQTTGTPATGLRASLSYIALPVAPESKLPAEEEFLAYTDDSTGRITHWQHVRTEGRPHGGQVLEQGYWKVCDDYPLAKLLEELRHAPGAKPGIWRLRLMTQEYWEKKGVQSFYPYVDVTFTVNQSEGRDHWHVPVLLGPHGYTTYRGT